MIRKLAILSLLWTFFTYEAVCLSAEGGIWVDCTGRAVVHNITPEEAKIKALNEARRNAVEQVCAIRLYAASVVEDGVLASDFIHTLSHGYIVAERDALWAIEETEGGGKEPPSITYVVTMWARVIKEEGEADPEFRVNLTLNRMTFEAGEEMVLTVSPTQDSYITILNWTADDSIRVLFPNALQTKCYLEAGDTLTVPSPSEQATGVRFRVYPLPGHRRDTEFIKAIATRDSISFVEDANRLGVLGTPILAITKLCRRLVSVPVQDRAEATASYHVVRIDE